jgi:putative mRNA 3-end processing factor
MPCDTLILDAAYGHQDYRHPDRRTVETSVRRWARESLDAGDIPVFLVGNPGKAQDLIQTLGKEDLPLRVHRQIHAYNKAYQSLGIDLPNTKQFRGAPSKGEVLVWPSHLKKSTSIRNLKRVKFAALTGRGDKTGVARRMRVAKVFTWSLRSDYEGLLNYVGACKPQSIITFGRHADTLATDLVARGNDAVSLHTESQLNLI